MTLRYNSYKIIRNLFFGFLLFSQLFLHAQKYRAFDTTVTWHTIRSGNGSSQGCFKDDSYNYYTKGYEINNSLYWHKVYANVILGYYAGASPSCAIQPSTTTAFIGYYNNDTLNKKVYFVPTGSLTTNFVPTNSNLLFDFNMNINGIFFISPGLTYQVNSIDSVLFSGKYHKKYNCATTFSANYSPSYAYVIEGIGSSVGVFNSGYNIFAQFSTPLLCFTNSNSTKYLFGAGRTQNWPKSIRDTISCAWIVTELNTTLNKTNYFKFFPNPSTGNLHIELETSADIQNFIIRITNLLGQIVQETKLEKTLNISSLKNGIYFLHVFDKGNLIGTEKIIKE